MRSDHLSKHIKRCQNRGTNLASRTSTTTNDSPILNKTNQLKTKMNENNECTTIDCTYSTNCIQCQNEQKQIMTNNDKPFLPPIVPSRNTPSPTSFSNSCPASMFYNHFNIPANLPISKTNLISFTNNPFSVFKDQKLNNHSIDSIIFKPSHLKSTFQPSYIISEDSSSCSSLPPQMYFS